MEASKDRLNKEFYETGKWVVKCDQPQCLETFYYYYRFGHNLRALRVFIIHKLIFLDKMIENIIFPIELRNYIYYYFLNIVQCDWIENVKVSSFGYIINDIEKRELISYDHVRLSTLIYFGDHETSSIMINLFGHCKGKSCHVNSIWVYGDYCDNCGLYYCEHCKHSQHV